MSVAQHSIAAYGSEKWVRYILKTAAAEDISAGALIAKALKVWAATSGAKAPPVRLERRKKSRRRRTTAAAR
jgi:hypothetical protein